MDVDFDPSLPDYEEKLKNTPAIIMSKAKDIGLLMLERSVNKGYHLVFRRNPALSQEENLQYVSSLLGVK